MPLTLAENFDRLTIPEPNSGCLLWLGPGTAAGRYGRIRINGKYRAASHVALDLAGRPLPQGMYACHHCDNPVCVNADHLFAGTQKDNIADMIAKGRSNFSALERKRERIRISDEVKEPARQMFKRGFGVHATARATNINVSTVQNWFRKWGHVPRAYRRKMGEQ